jgi:hypothetical protein
MMDYCQKTESVNAPRATSVYSSLVRRIIVDTVRFIDKIQCEISPHITPSAEYNLEDDSRDKASVSSSLPRGWSGIHDRFIAYLETHAPLSDDEPIPAREWGNRCYNTDHMIYMLHKKFPEFQNIVSL